MEKFFTLFTIAIAALGMTSCFESKSVISINKDGAGTIEETTIMSAQTKALMESIAEDGSDDPPPVTFKDMPDKKEAQARAKTFGKGVTLKSHEEITLPDGRLGIRNVYAVADITKLKYSPEMFQYDHLPMTFDRSGNTLMITIPGKKKEQTPQPEKSRKATREELKMTRTMTAGLHITIEIKVPGGIASTDASHATADTITLLHVDGDKVMKKNANLIALFEAQDMTAAEAAERMKGVNDFKVEAKKTVKVEMK